MTVNYSENLTAYSTALMQHHTHMTVFLDSTGLLKRLNVCDSRENC